MKGLAEGQSATGEPQRGRMRVSILLQEFVLVKRRMVRKEG
jgi:hypothetical protein